MVRRPEVTRSIRFLDSGNEKSKIVSWAGPIEQLLGYTSGEVETNDNWWTDSIHADDREQLFSTLSNHFEPAPVNPFAAEARLWSLEYRARHVNGTYIVISDNSVATRNEQGVLISVQSTLYDKFTRRKSREDHRKVLDSHNLVSLVADNTASGIYMMDPQGYCIFMNKSAEKITGFTFEELYGHPFHAATHSCHPSGAPYPITDCPIFNHSQDGTAAKSQSEVFVHRDGHHYAIEFSVSPIEDYSTGGAIIEFRDVSEQKRIEQERLSAILLAEQQSSRIASDEAHKRNMASFVSFVCHELRNPLQGITSSAEFLFETLQKLEDITRDLSGQIDINPSPEAPFDKLRNDMMQANLLDSQKEHSISNRQFAVSEARLAEMKKVISYSKELAVNITTCADHQALIANNVLDLSRLDAGKVAPVLEIIDVHSIQCQVIHMMSARAQNKKIVLSKAQENPEPLYLKADATLLRQVLLNLVGNAIKFTQEHGLIIIDLFASADASKDEHCTTLHGSVTDDGLGMSISEQEHLFQRFSQANRKVAQLYGGSGLGLSISRELLKTMGGDITVESEQGKGSTFRFTSQLLVPSGDELTRFLSQGIDSSSPTSCAGDVVLTRGVAVAATAPPKFRCIGVAEDNPINLRHLARHLDKLGYETVLCVNGKEILEKVCEPDSPIDCCVIDMSMPVMDGTEAARRIRAREKEMGIGSGSRSKIPIIALSGNTLKEQIDDALSAGCSDYMTKPCKQADLGRTLRYWERIVHTGAKHKAMLER